MSMFPGAKHHRSTCRHPQTKQMLCVARDAWTIAMTPLRVNFINVFKTPVTQGQPSGRTRAAIDTSFLLNFPHRITIVLACFLRYVVYRHYRLAIASSHPKLCTFNSQLALSEFPGICVLQITDMFVPNCLIYNIQAFQPVRHCVHVKPHALRMVKHRRLPDHSYAPRTRDRNESSL